MHPVHEFKTNFSQAELATQSQPDSVADAFTLHDADSSVRNICFVWEDGRKTLFNYAYLVSVELTLDSRENLMWLYFGSYTVSLKGYNLGLLFDLLMNHDLKAITITNARYITDTNKTRIVVIDILVKTE